MCDGSFGKYFASGKHIYDFCVNVPTTFAIVVEAFGGSRESTKGKELEHMWGEVAMMMSGCTHRYGIEDGPNGSHEYMGMRFRVYSLVHEVLWMLVR